MVATKLRMIRSIWKNFINDLLPTSPANTSSMKLSLSTSAGSGGGAGGASITWRTSGLGGGEGRGRRSLYLYRRWFLRAGLPEEISGETAKNDNDRRNCSCNLGILFQG